MPPRGGSFLRLDVRLYVFVHPEGLKGQIQVFLDNSIFFITATIIFTTSVNVCDCLIKELKVMPPGGCTAKQPYQNT